MATTRKGFLLIVLLVVAPLTSAQQLIDHPEPAQALSNKWRWALEQSAGNEQAWIAYQFTTTIDERLNDANNFRNHYNYNNAVRLFGDGKRLSLDALRAGISNGKQGYTRSVDLVLKARVVGGALEQVELTTVATPTHWQGAPVYWLGTATLSASFRHLGELLQPSQANKANAGLIHALALHAHSDRTPYLYSLYSSEQWRELRPYLIASMAMQRSQDMENLLLELLAENESEEERRVVITALSQYESQIVLESLVALTDEGQTQAIREEATQALGHFNGAAARDRLNEIAWSAADADLREEAVESLARQGDREANALLLELARNHPNSKTRREAVRELEDNLL